MDTTGYWPKLIDSDPWYTVKAYSEQIAAKLDAGGRGVLVADYAPGFSTSSATYEEFWSHTFTVAVGGNRKIKVDMSGLVHSSSAGAGIFAGFVIDGASKGNWAYTTFAQSMGQSGSRVVVLPPGAHTVSLRLSLAGSGYTAHAREVALTVADVGPG